MIKGIAGRVREGFHGRTDPDASECWDRIA
jgi:hypothetical protein